MKIINLKVENYMRIEAVEITPDGNAVLITGKNGEGKSSILDAIMACLCGKKYHPVKPIRDGEERAEIVIDTGNYIVTRTFDAKGGSLKVTNAEGMEAKSPQKLLDKIVGEIAFDPMSFVEIGDTEAGRRQQRATLMELTKLDFSDIDIAIASKKQERSDVKRDKERLEHSAEAITVAEGTPDKLLSVSDLTNKLDAANGHNVKQGLVRQHVENLDCDLVRIDKEMRTLDAEKLQLDEKLASLKKKWQESRELHGIYEKKQKELKASIQDDIDTYEIMTDIGGVEATNTAVRQKKEKELLTLEAKNEQTKYAQLGADMKDLDQQKAKRLADAKMPLEGLSVTDDGVTFEGIPLNQVNDAKLLEIGMGIAMAENPTLRVIRMNGNNLDEDSLEVIKKMAKENDYQVWVERWHGDENGIVIEDGSVKPK